VKCSQCGREEAEYAVVDYEWVQVFCEGCFREYIAMNGEIDTDWMTVSITGIGAEKFLKTLNDILRYHEEQYERLLRQYDDLKKRAICDMAGTELCQYYQQRSPPCHYAQTHMVGFCPYGLKDAKEAKPCV